MTRRRPRETSRRSISSKTPWNCSAMRARSRHQRPPRPGAPSPRPVSQAITPQPRTPPPRWSRRLSRNFSEPASRSALYAPVSAHLGDDVEGVVGADQRAVRAQATKPQQQMRLVGLSVDHFHAVDLAPVPAVGLGALAKIGEVIGALIRVVGDPTLRADAKMREVESVLHAGAVAGVDGRDVALHHGEGFTGHGLVDVHRALLRFVAR